MPMSEFKNTGDLMSWLETAPSGDRAVWQYATNKRVILTCIYQGKVAAAVGDYGQVWLRVNRKPYLDPPKPQPEPAPPEPQTDTAAAIKNWLRDAQDGEPLHLDEKTTIWAVVTKDIRIAVDKKHKLVAYAATVGEKSQ